jgi:inorganic pyrophosphatase
VVNLFELDPGSGIPKLVRMIVEIPKGATNKYEYDVETGVFRLDRPLYSPMHYPGDYGFIPGTLAEDQDPADVLALMESPSFPGCMIEVRPIGVLDMEDQEEGDHKIVAVPTSNPRYHQIQSMEDVFPHVRRELEHFFAIYKELEGRRTRMLGWGGVDEAHHVIMSSRERFLSSMAGRPIPG